MISVKFKDITAGCKVKFRCGGEATTDDWMMGRLCNGITFVEFPELIFEYDDLGIYGDNHPLDIVEIIPKPYDWNEAKYKDAFIRNGGENPIYYLCSNPDNEDKVYVGCFSKNYDCLYNSFDVLKSEITRSPEHDLPLP